MSRASGAAFALSLLLPMAAASAEFVPPPDWEEASAVGAPSWSRARLIPIETPRGSSLSFGVDPATITVGADGVVRVHAPNLTHERCARPTGRSVTMGP